MHTFNDALPNNRTPDFHQRLPIGKKDGKKCDDLDNKCRGNHIKTKILLLFFFCSKAHITFQKQYSICGYIVIQKHKKKDHGWSDL